MTNTHVALAAALMALSGISAACQDSGAPPEGIQSRFDPPSRNPDQSSWDGTTMGDQERDHDLRRGLLRSDGLAAGSSEPTEAQKAAGDASAGR